MKCQAAKKCGGCSLLEVPYEKQLQQKHKEVQKLLKPFCGVQPVRGMDSPWHYRNKVHAALGRKRDGTILSGIYEEGTHRIVPVKSCLIENEKADEIIQTIVQLIPSFRYTIFNEDSGYGLLRHILVRVGVSTGQVMVVLVANALRSRHPEIKTIVLNVNDRKTSMILGEKEQVLYGPGYIEDRLCGLTFRISSRSFYQVNPAQTQVLYEAAIDLAGLNGKQKVIDAYSGIGTIGMVAASGAKEVLSIEQNPDAVRDAIMNARRNSISNIRFYRADATNFMMQLAAEKEHCDVLFMDPPRSGSTPEFVRAAAAMQPERIIYVSCNPQTLARDLRWFGKMKYRAETAVPVDMFAQTEHVETVCLLTHS